MRSKATISDTKSVFKLLFISHNSELCGAERSLLILLKHLNRNFFEPIVALPRNGPLNEKLRQLDIKTYEVSSPWWVSTPGRKDGIVKRVLEEIKVLVRLYKIIKKEEIDLIYTNTIVIFSGALAGFVARRPHIWHIREIVPGNPDLSFFLPGRMLFKFISKTSAKIIANSNATVSQFQDMNTNGRLRVVYNAQEICDSYKSDSLNDIDGISPADWLVAVVGTLQRRKAQDDAIRAVRIAERTIPNIKLVLIGDGMKEYKDYLKILSKELDISKRVVFAGYRNDVPQILSGCKLLLIPSWNEPFGRVIIEAMAAGIPVVGTDSGGAKEIIQRDVTGYLVRPKMPFEMAEKIIHLFKNPNVAKKLGLNGKKVAAERFNVSNYVSGVEAVLRDVLGI